MSKFLEKNIVPLLKLICSCYTWMFLSFIVIMPSDYVQAQDPDEEGEIFWGDDEDEGLDEGLREEREFPGDDGERVGREARRGDRRLPRERQKVEQELSNNPPKRDPKSSKIEVWGVPEALGGDLGPFWPPGPPRTAKGRQILVRGSPRGTPKGTFFCICFRYF